MDLREVISEDRLVILDQKFENKEALLETLFSLCAGSED